MFLIHNGSGFFFWVFLSLLSPFIERIKNKIKLSKSIHLIRLLTPKNQVDRIPINKKAETAQIRDFSLFSEASETRTPDNLIKSQVPYHLS